MFSAGFAVAVGLKLLGFAAVGGCVAGEGHRREVHDAGVWVGAVTDVVVAVDVGVVAPAAADAVAELEPLPPVAAGVERAVASEAEEPEPEPEI